MRRQLVRKAIARRLICSPYDVVIKRSSNGKPEVQGAPFWVSWSYAGEWTMLAFSRHGPVGIDAERRAELPDLQGLVARYAGKAKNEILSAEHPRDAFYRWWTRLEAVVKAMGCRMADALDSGASSKLLASVPARLVDLHPDLVIHVALATGTSLEHVMNGPGVAAEAESAPAFAFDYGRIGASSRRSWASIQESGHVTTDQWTYPPVSLPGN